MPKEPGSLNCPLCAYLMRQNILKDLGKMKILATFQNDPRKIIGMRALTVIPNV